MPGPSRSHEILERSRRLWLHLASNSRRHWRFVALVLVLSAGPVAVALIAVFGVPALAQWTREHQALIRASAVTGLVIAAVLLLLTPVFLSSYPPAREGRAAARGGRIAVLAAVLLTVLSVTQQIAGNIVASVVDRRLEARLPSAAAFYRNHDLAHVVGNALSMLILRRRDREPDGDADRPALERLAEHARVAWLALVTDESPTADEQLRALTEPRLVAFVADPRTQALAPPHWETLLSSWESEAAVQLSGLARETLALEICEDFGISLREAVKHDAVTGGKGAKALELDVQAVLLQRALVEPDRKDPHTREALRALDHSMAATHGAVERLRADTSRHAREVVERIDDVERRLTGLLEEILATVGSIKDDTTGLVISVDELKRGIQNLHSAGPGGEVPAIQRFRVLVYDHPFAGSDRKVLGETTTEVKASDGLQIEALLGRPAFAYLLSLDTDGACVLRWPTDPSRPPPLASELLFVFPSLGDRFQAEVAGWQGFVLVCSERPLPAFDEWKRGEPPLAWTHVAATQGSDAPVLELRENGDIRPPETMRGGMQAIVSEPIRAVAKALRQRAEGARVRAILFAVSAD